VCHRVALLIIALLWVSIATSSMLDFAEACNCVLAFPRCYLCVWSCINWRGASPQEVLPGV
jgi:hypothetical protein